MISDLGAAAKIMDDIWDNSTEKPVWPNVEPVKPGEGETFYKCCDHCYPPPNQNGCATLNAHTVPCNEGEVPCGEGKEVVAHG